MNFFQQERLQTFAKEKALKEDCQLFSKLFISRQSRECDLHEFFRHGNQSFPAALSDGGRLHVCQKSQLAAILEAKVTLPDAEPVTDAIIIDGSALVNTLPPRTSKTFAEYAVLEFIPRVEARAMKYQRTDIVFDVYLYHRVSNQKLYRNEDKEPDAGSQGLESCHGTGAASFVILPTKQSCLNTWLRT